MCKVKSSQELLGILYILVLTRGIFRLKSTISKTRDSKESSKWRRNKFVRGR